MATTAWPAAGRSSTTTSSAWAPCPASPSCPSPSEAAGFINALTTTGGGHLWQPGPGFPGRLLQAAEARGIHGPRIFDLQIALTAVEAGASEIWTHDQGFVTVPGLRVRDPFARI